LVVPEGRALWQRLGNTDALDIQTVLDGYEVVPLGPHRTPRWGRNGDTGEEESDGKDGDVCPALHLGSF
jgi:hypothetical protein